MSEARVSLGRSAPQLFKIVSQLDQETAAHAKEAGWDESFLHLLKLRASQINGCAFCVQMHTADAVKRGESTDRIALLSAWRESGFYSERERAGLALIEAVTLISDGQVPDATYAEAARVLSESEISAVEWIAVVINAWNRIAISSRMPANPK